MYKLHQTTYISVKYNQKIVFFRQLMYLSTTISALKRHSESSYKYTKTGTRERLIVRDRGESE
jgi:hypothetical protein